MLETEIEETVYALYEMEFENDAKWSFITTQLADLELKQE